MAIQMSKLLSSTSDSNVLTYVKPKLNYIIERCSYMLNPVQLFLYVMRTL